MREMGADRLSKRKSRKAMGENLNFQERRGCRGEGHV